MLCMKHRACRAARTAPSALPHDARGSRPVSVSREKHLVSPGEYGAWLFDLDGELRTRGGPDERPRHRRARGDDPEVLRQNGADVVIRDLAELSLV